MTDKYDPKTLEDFNAKYMKNHTIFGFGIEGVGMTLPCPGCAEPNFLTYKVIDFQEAIAKVTICQKCLRGFHGLITGSGGNILLEIVQTRGTPVPDYLPPIRHL
jgi:hypothetical protein